VGKVYLLEGPQQALPCRRNGADVRIELPAMLVAPQLPTVVVLEVKGAPIVYKAPAITAESGEFVSGLEVAIASGSPGLAVHYTLDGSEPTSNSPVAEAPVRIGATCTVQARAFHRGAPVSAVVARTFTKVTPSPPVEPVAPRQGLVLTKFAVDWNTIPAGLDALTPASTGTASTVGCGKAPGEHVAQRFTGFLDVPESELYRFSLLSDDGSKLWLDGQLAIDNDGLHGASAKGCAVALGKGLHPIEVVWFNKTGGAELVLSWARPGGRFEPVPANALRH